MPTGNEQLVVRQHERLTCRLAATLRVADEHAKQVALARSAGDGSGMLPVTVVDCSRGGLGLDLPMFLPRACRVRVTVSVQPDPAQPPASVEFLARVQRIGMTTRTPTYYLGLAFIPEGADHANKVDKLMACVRAATPKPSAASTGAPATPSSSAPAPGEPSPAHLRRAG